MTALALLWDYSGENPAPLLDRMLAAQAIYGRETALSAVGPVAMGRRLWPLTPEDRFDRGPVTGSLVIAGDVRIDNRDAIAARLGIGAGELASSSDMALVARMIEQFGEAGIDALVGPFAIMAWDARRERLILARDALGERPLHYHCGTGFVAVASMPKGLHAHPAIGCAANVWATADFLALVPETGPESFFEGIQRVLPGHIVTIEHKDGRATVQSRRFWQPDLRPFRLESDEAYAAGLRQLLDQAVTCRLRRASGAVGAHLSAGLDSSAVAATAARLLPSERLIALTAVPAHAVTAARAQIADEGPLASATAVLYPNIDHVRVAAQGSPVGLMDRQFHLFERPVLNPSNTLWSEAINDAARAGNVTVLLTGQMGNLSISHDGLTCLPRLLRRGQWVRLARLLVQLARNGASVRQLAAVTIGPFMSPGVWSWLARRIGRDLPLHRYSALRADAFDARDVAARSAARGLDLSYRPWADGTAMRLWGLARVDMGVYNKGTLAGWGIDLRDPTADRRLIEWALRVPEHQYVLGGVPRSLARRAFADRLPQVVLTERRRGLQGADWHVNLTAARAEIAAELDSFGRCAGAHELVDVERLQQLLADWPETGWQREDTSFTYRHAMLRAVAAGHFLRKVARTN